jgi:two-component system sensor histidine kinase DegS
VVREGAGLDDLMAARLEAARAAEGPLTAELARAREELAESRVIRGHLSQHPERFSAPEREAVLERGEELAARCRELEAGIESASAIATLLEELRGAAAEVVVAERMRIARDLHDGPLQALSNLVLEAEVLERLIERDPRGAAAELQQFRGAVRDAIADLRGVLAGMRPPSVQELGLATALRRLASDWEARSGAGCRLKIAGEGRELAPELEETLFWIVAEALTNVQRHARAGRVAVDLDIRGESAGVRVRDDGQGFDVAAAAAPGGAPRLGLLGMRERVLAAGGSLEVRSRPGSGTVVEAELPIKVRASG